MLFSCMIQLLCSFHMVELAEISFAVQYSVICGRRDCVSP